MFKHIVNIFRVNISLKMISIGLAFILWLVVVNVSNPEVTDTVTMDIDVNYGDELINKGKYFTLDTRSVKVSYKVRTNQRSLIQPSSFDAYVDMRDYSITGAVPVYVTVDSGVNNLISGITQSPMVIHVSTEDMQEKQFTVSARVNGSPAEGFVAGDPVIQPASVSLYGPESEIGKISRVGIAIDIEGAEDTKTGNGRIQYFDANDNVITIGDKVSLSSDVSYTIPVYKTKSVSINIPTSGQPAAGYTLTGVETEPRFIQVYGEDDILRNYNTIYLPEGLLDISGVSSNVTISLAMQNYLPEGLNMVQQSDVTIVARISRQTDLIPGMGNLPSATIQAPPTATQPETTASHPETEHSTEASEHAEETEAPEQTDHTDVPEETTVHDGSGASHDTSGNESLDDGSTDEGSSGSESDVVIHPGIDSSGTQEADVSAESHEVSGGEAGDTSSHETSGSEHTEGAGGEAEGGAGE